MIRKLRFKFLKEDFNPEFLMVLNIKQKRKQHSYQRFQEYNKLRVAFKKEDFHVIHNFKNKHLEVLLRKQTNVIKLLRMNNFIAYLESGEFGFFKYYTEGLDKFIEKTLMFFQWKSKIYNRAFALYFKENVTHYHTKLCQQLVAHMAQNIFSIQQASVVLTNTLFLHKNALKES